MSTNVYFSKVHFLDVKMKETFLTFTTVMIRTKESTIVS